MFAIIISEKGGAERRERFDKSEINVGRVHGNDLVLPKGNVSKHHTRLLFRDGRFIVTDLKSTNGTYVNGRKIAQATIVRDGDKIYIGDFVLRLETGAAAAAAAPGAAVAAHPALEATAAGEEGAAVRTGSRDNMPPRPLNNPPAVTLKAPTHPPPPAMSRPLGPNVPLQLPSASAVSPDRAPEESGALQPPRAPSAPPPSVMPPPVMPPPIVAGGAGSRPMMTLPLNQPPPSMSPRVPPAAPGALQPSALPPLAPPPPASKAAMMPPMVSEPLAADAGAPAAALDRPRHRSAPSMRAASKDSSVLAARRLALTMLLGRVADAVDLSPLRMNAHVSEALARQIEHAAREQASAMREEGEAPADIDLEAVVHTAHRELVGLGALEPLLDDEDVHEIHCVRYDQILSVRRDGGTVYESAAFSSDEALRRVVVRLAEQSGEPWRADEAVVERRLSRGALVAVAPPVSSMHVLSFQKRRRVDVTLEDLVQQSSMSRAMGQFLEACVAGRANILVAGTTTESILSALASTGATGERVCVVQDLQEIVVAGGAHVIPLSIVSAGGADCVRAASRMRPDRLVVAHLAGAVAAATLDAVSEGGEGVLAAIRAATLRQALSRLVAQLVLHRVGLGVESVRDVVSESFDIALETVTLPDGRVRVTRIAELGGTDAKGLVIRDIFVANGDAGVEGGFSATGVVPRLAGELVARGIKLESTTFKRSVRPS